MLHKRFLAIKTCHEIYNRSQRIQLFAVTLDLPFSLKNASFEIVPLLLMEICVNKRSECTGFEGSLGCAGKSLIFTSPLKNSPSGHPVFYTGAGPTFLWGVVEGVAWLCTFLNCLFIISEHQPPL